MLWTAYVNGGRVPRGADFARAVRELAERVGVDPSPLDRAEPRDRRADLLQKFFDLSRRELAGERGGDARAYLARRGFPHDMIESTGLGLVPAPAATRQLLQRAGYREAEIAASGILADSRWPGRLCGAWRNEYGLIGTLWARSVDGSAAADSRYLYLRGASRTNLPPYGLLEVLAQPPDARREIVLVEGFLDVHQLRAHRVENVAALGGTSTTPLTFERLHRLGIDLVTLCLDNDDAGRTAAARAVEHSAKSRHSPEICVIDPERLESAKDPDELVRQSGIEGWWALLAAKESGVTWRARELVAGVTADAPACARREALARAGSWLGSLPARFALEQEDAIRVISSLCGYSPEAVERAFRARFWPAPERRRGLAPSLER
jgi:DNA primase